MWPSKNEQEVRWLFSDNFVFLPFLLFVVKEKVHFALIKRFNETHSTQCAVMKKCKNVVFVL